MSGAGALLEDLARRGVRLAANGDRLLIDAPAALLTVADREAIWAAKPELLVYLTRNARQDALEAALPAVTAQVPTLATLPARSASVGRVMERQLAAVEGLRRLAASGDLGACDRRATIELPNGQRVRIVPAGADHDRPGLLHLTWAELGADPLVALARANQITGALATFGGRLIEATAPSPRATGCRP